MCLNINPPTKMIKDLWIWYRYSFIHITEVHSLVICKYSRFLYTFRLIFIYSWTRATEIWGYKQKVGKLLMKKSKDVLVETGLLLTRSPPITALWHSSSELPHLRFSLHSPYLVCKYSRNYTDDTKEKTMHGGLESTYFLKISSGKFCVCSVVC